MSDINISFCRYYLTEVHKEVKRHFPDVNLIQDASIYKCLTGQYEFRGPDDFVSYHDATNAYEARAVGWEAYLRHKGIE